MLVEENRELAPFTTLGVGGPARWFVEAGIEKDVVDSAAWAREKNVPLFVLGGGSNLVVADHGFNGLVLHVGVRGVQKYEQAEHMVYEVGAGEEWDAIVQRSVADNCAGLECLAGIPGTVGGTPVQNVGAYGQEVASTILSVRAFDMKTLAFVDLSPAECGFAYRRSRFNTADRGRYVITRVAYSLMPGGAATIRYADLQNEFSGRSDPSVKEVAEAVRQVRRTKGMLLVDGDPNCRSAGSFFKNPVVRAEQMHLIAANEGKDPPHFPVGSQEQQSGCAKIPAAWLIEHAGFAKGFAQGQAGISSRHTLALINRGGAKAAEILALADQIASAVNSHFGIQLEREPVLLGFEESC